MLRRHHTHTHTHTHTHPPHRERKEETILLRVKWPTLQNAFVAQRTLSSLQMLAILSMTESFFCFQSYQLSLSGTFVIRVEKENPGEHFDGLDLLTKLLAPTGKSAAAGPLIEVIGESPNI